VALGLLAAAPAARGQQVPPRTVVTSRAPGWLGLWLDGYAVPAGTPGAVGGVRLIVTDLYRGGPAEQGGLRPGDVLVRVNGAPADFQVFQSLAGRLLPGDPLALAVLRDGRVHELSVRASQRPEPAELAPRETRLVQVQLDSVRRAFEERLATVRDRFGAVEGTAVLRIAPEVHVERALGDSLTTVVVLTRPDGSVVRLREVGSPAAFAYGYRMGASAEPAGEAPSARLRVMVRRSAPEEARPTEVEPGMPWRPLAPYLVGANRVAGAEVRSLDAALGGYFGVERGLLVVEVAEGSPARAAGLQAGDVILRVDGREPGSVAELRALLAQSRTAVAIGVLRRGRSLDLTLPR
jgi:membrane-associated protease RseP (regulator of RpoE activity)